METQDVLAFWFAEENRPYWFAKNPAFDEKVNMLFYPLWQRAAAGTLHGWRKTMQGRLAEIIILDQFSRNLFRNSPQAYAQDLAALCLAQEAITRPGFAAMTPEERQFMLMPFMHSESAELHAHAVGVFKQYAPGAPLDFELKHQAVIDRFGRYPHRNAVLGRESTPEELKFLAAEGRGF
ncbi:DUF924 family protein [Neisseria bacilliformis]|uniref:DUF924 family protein n=1 Tax=Neisseria bacilliformis TaxID=267212 RepID=UPI0028EC563C|nr:DUF924 family protein [Neisseria bacilliformis]